MIDNIEWGKWTDGPVPYPCPKYLQTEQRAGTIVAYRIGTVKPVVTTEALYWRSNDAAGGSRWPTDTHRITITLHDGKPVGIAIEELK